MGQGSCRAKAQRHRRECSLSLTGEALVGPGAHSGGVLPRFSLRCRRRARLQGRRLDKAELRRGGPSLSLPGEARVGPGAHSGVVRARFSLRTQRRARRQGHRRAEAERLRRGSSLSQLGKAGSGREPTRVGSCRDSACAPKAAPGFMGVAGQQPSKAGVGSASPSPRAKPGSVQGREPTRVGSCPGSACAAEGAPGCKGVAGPKPSVAGGGLGRTGSPPGGSSPDSALTAEGAQCCMGVARPKLSDAGESAASPSWAKPVSGREPTRVGSGLRC